MQIATLIEPIAGRGYRASTRSPIEIAVEANSKEEAIRMLQEGVQARLAGGAELINVEATAEPHPWLEFAGGLKDHPLLDQWRQAMADFRVQVDREEAGRDALRDAESP